MHWSQSFKVYNTFALKSSSSPFLIKLTSSFPFIYSFWCWSRWIIKKASLDNRPYCSCLMSKNIQKYFHFDVNNSSFKSQKKVKKSNLLIFQKESKISDDHVKKFDAIIKFSCAAVNNKSRKARLTRFGNCVIFDVQSAHKNFNFDTLLSSALILTKMFSLSEIEREITFQTVLKTCHNEDKSMINRFLMWIICSCKFISS